MPTLYPTDYLTPLLHRLQTAINRGQLPGTPNRIASALAIDGAHGRQFDLEVLHSAAVVPIATYRGVGHVHARAAVRGFAGSALVSVDGGDLLGGPD